MIYNVSVTQYSKNQQAVIDSHCNGWTAINIGTTVVNVKGIPLNPGTPGTNNGESFTIGGNAGEIFKGRVDIEFPTGSGNVLLIQKFYFDECRPR